MPNIDYLLDSLRNAVSEAEDKESELTELKYELDNALGEIEDFKTNLESTIDALENLGDLSVSYSFTYSADDFDISVG